ncbi:MAG: hypothetical protein JXB88_20460 [Spirochaetales bacterium]|nr:hypothetical protein [Spirochaetales bacterium]
MNKVFFLFLLSITVSPLISQPHLAVDIHHPVYRILEIAEIKGAVKNLSRAKPYSRSMVVTLLNQIYENREQLDSTEQIIVNQMIEEFKETPKGISKGNIPFRGLLGDAIFGIKATGNTQLNCNDLESWHMHNALCFYLKGNIDSFLSYYGSFGFTYDRVNPGSYVPYSFTKEWDGFHLGFGDPRYSLEGIEPFPYFSFRIEDEICTEFFDNNLLLRWARLRRDWGSSEGTLYLSKSARPYEGIDLYAKITPFMKLSYTFGSLSDWHKEIQLKEIPSASSYEKMFTLQMLEFFPFEWLTLSVAASALWGKRFEIGYLNPLLYPIIHQNLHGDFDNVNQSVNLIFHLPRYAMFYFSFFADEMELTNLEHFFTSPRNMIALQAGTKVPVPFFSFSLFTFQYTKIEPFVYTHYPEEHYYSSSVPVDLSYTHDGENIGYHLPPNSDEFLVKIESRILPYLDISLQYQLIRHGTNNREIAGDIAIYGDNDEYLYYERLDEYPDKVFLKDGLYDWNNIISIQAAWKIPDINAILTFGYSFSYIWWVENESGITPPDDTMKNIFSFSYKIF